MEKTRICDTRPFSDFSSKTISKYNKTDVKNALIQSLLKEKIENSCHWSAELICSGHFAELWETILFFLGKHIYLGNTSLPIYLYNRYQQFRVIMNHRIDRGFLHEIELRNDQTIRELFAEIITILTLSKKKSNIEYIKIDREDEFDMTKQKDQLRAPTIEVIELFKKEDPKELLIPINEFHYCLSIKDTKKACYWVDWLIEFDFICRQRKEPCYCEKRDYSVDKKCVRDSIWLVWETILYVGRDSPMFMKINNSLFSLFQIKYTNACCKKRRYILYYAVSILTEPFEIQEIVNDKTMVTYMKEKIGDVYKTIKKNEVVEESYILMGLSEKEKNLKKSIDKMNQIDNVYI